MSPTHQQTDRYDAFLTRWDQHSAPGNGTIDLGCDNLMCPELKRNNPFNNVTLDALKTSKRQEDFGAAMTIKLDNDSKLVCKGKTKTE